MFNSDEDSSIINGLIPLPQENEALDSLYYLFSNYQETIIDEDAKETILIKPNDKPLEQLYEEITATNSSEILGSRIDNLKEIFEQFSILKTQFITYDFINKPLNECSLSDISLITECYKESNFFANNKNIPELLALINRAVYLIDGYYPRDIQMISLINFLSSSEHGLLLQIRTGEGKSLTSAMLAVSQVLIGHSHVDIITSSPILAQREAESKKSFFDIFGISVSHNCYTQHEKFKECYSANIVYGDTSNFQFDYLRHEYERQNTRGERVFDILIADEVDSMFIDEGSKIAMISSGFPGSEYLELLFMLLYNRLALMNQHLKEEDGQIVFFDNESQKIISDVKAFKKECLSNYLEELSHNITEIDIDIVPNYMSDFIALQKDVWIDSILKAELMEEGVNYVLLHRDGKLVIAPVDYANTGVTQSNTSWSCGLHQFLQIKHSLKIEPEDLVAKFISNLGFFKKYGNKIFGMTGTLGSKESMNFLKEEYGVDLGFIPTFRDKKFQEIEGIIAENEFLWLNNIYNIANSCVQSNRAVLIISKTILDCNRINNFFLSQNFPASKIKLYMRSDDIGSGGEIDPLLPGDVIMATNLAGRGTDIETSKIVESNGGLHVVVTYLPNNLRIEEQAFGRTSRCGNDGSAQLVINIETLPEKFKNYTGSADSLSRMKFLRDVLESERIKQAAAVEIHNLKIKDNLFNRFCELTSPWRGQKEHQYKCAQIEEKWGIFIKKLTLSENAIDEASANKEFEALASYVHSSFTYTNPNYIVKNGINAFCESYIKAQDLLSSAISIDPSFCFTAHYYKAYGILRKANEDYCRTKKACPPDYLVNASSEITSAKEIIAQQLIPSLEVMKVLIPKIGESELLIQINNKIKILEIHQKNMDGIISKIKNADPETHRIVIGDVSLIRDKLRDSEDIEQEKKTSSYYEHEIRDFESVGLFHFYDVTTIEYPTDFWSGALMATLGLGQIILGVVFAASLTTPVLAAVLLSGAKDIFTSFDIFLGEIKHFDWKNYRLDKAINVAISLVAHGIEKIQASLAAKKEAIAAGSKGLEITAGATKTGNAMISGSGSSVSGEVAKATVKEAIKQAALNLVVNGVVDIVADNAIEELLKNFRSSFQKEALSSINDLLSQEGIKFALERIAFEEKRSSHKYSVELTNHINSAFRTHSNVLVGIISGVLGKLGDSGSEYATKAKILDKALTVGRISQAISEASEIFDNISDSLEGKIMEVASKLPSLEELISADLVKKHQSNTDVTAKRLVGLLREAGLVNGDIVLSSDVKNISASREDISELGRIQTLLVSLCKIKTRSDGFTIVLKEKLEESYINRSLSLLDSRLRHDILKPAAAPILADITKAGLGKLYEIAQDFKQDRFKKDAPKASEEIVSEHESSGMPKSESFKKQKASYYQEEGDYVKLSSELNYTSTGDIGEDQIFGILVESGTDPRIARALIENKDHGREVDPGLVGKALKSGAEYIRQQLQQIDPDDIDGLRRVGDILNSYRYAVNIISGGRSGAIVGGIVGLVPGSVIGGVIGGVAGAAKSYAEDKVSDAGIALSSEALLSSYPNLSKDDADLLANTAFIAYGGKDLVKSLAIKARSGARKVSESTLGLAYKDDLVYAGGGKLDFGDASQSKSESALFKKNVADEGGLKPVAHEQCAKDVDSKIKLELHKQKIDDHAPVADSVAPELSTPTKLNGNDLRNPNPTHIYKIIKNDEEIMKIGESAAGVNKYGLSKRAETQVRKLKRLDTNNDYESKIVRTYHNKAVARKFETKLIEKRKNADPNSLPLNKTNR